MSFQRSLVGVLVVLVIVAGVGGYFAGSSAVPPPRTVTSTAIQTVTTTAAAATVTVTSTITPPPVTVTSTVTPPPRTVTVTVTPTPTPPPIAWPTRPVTIVVGFGAGGGSDLAARAYAPVLQNLTGVPWTVVNMPGGGGAIAEAYIAEQPADGYTVLLYGAYAVGNIILGKNKYKMEDYIPICRFQWDVGGLWVRADDTRFKTIQDFINYAKEREVTVGGTGLGQIPDHLNTALLAKYTGARLRYIPYESASEMRTDLLGGKIDAMMEEPGIIVPLIREGRVKALVFFVDKRLSDFPDVPVATELRLNITYGLWRGLAVRAGVSGDIVKKLEWLCEQAYSSPYYKEQEQKQYLYYRPGLLVGDAFREFVRSEYTTYLQVFKEIGLIS
ncbi:MAG: tripartite tricarboxylate transporter substrate binding protein [Sulfolobales archaeon]|nr:tripartite tricarboxylate transporter substrate binding protein [Sulfolobales archaeon]